MIKQRTLEIALERLEKPASPKPEFEQYTTPSDIAADMIWTALSFGDIQGKKVADLGCGNGILGIGAALVGASEVWCYDADPGMADLCMSNATSNKVNVKTFCSDVEAVTERFDTVLQNPPFGAQKPGADRPFLRAAMRISRVTYSLHLTETIDFVSKYCTDAKSDVSHIKNYKFKIPFMFEFHRKPVEFVYVSLVRIVQGR